ncbi:MAG: cyclic pyranopterin monophosphate synthase MoaC [Dehalococcoidia bacterium]
MVDISAKADTERVAVAKGRVVMTPATLGLVRSGQGAKGDILAVARVAGIMAAKKTPDLIPLCHPLLITDVAIDFELDEAGSAVEITATVRTTGKTGVEMEAMTAVSVAALTIYDMGKAADRAMRIEAVRLARKSGGKSGDIVLE